MAVFYLISFICLGLLPRILGRRSRFSLRDWLCLGWGLLLGTGSLPLPGPEMLVILVFLTYRTLRPVRPGNEGYVSRVPASPREEDELGEAAELALVAVHHDHALVAISEELLQPVES